MRARLWWLAFAATAVSLGTPGCNGAEPPTSPSPVCTYVLAPGSATYGPDGGAGTVTLSVSSGCAWSVAGAPAWITLTSAAEGTGPATLAYVVAANPAAAGRTATLALGGQTHTIVQDARPAIACAYQIAPASAELTKDQSSGGFTVTAPADCGWSAVSNAGWVTVTAGQQGVGTGSVSFTVSRNLTIEDRTAAIAVADRMFAIRQAGDTGGCEYSVAPVDLAACMPAGTLMASIVTQPNCPWTATTSASWLAVAGTSGRGPAVLTIAFQENYDAPRSGTVMVRWPTPTAGQNLRLAQAGCVYAVSRAGFSIAAAGGTDGFDVFQQAQPNTCGGATQDRCVWTAAADVPWIAVAGSMPRAGDGHVSFTVGAHEGTTSRVGHIRVRDQVVTITQSGR